MAGYADFGKSGSQVRLLVVEDQSKMASFIRKGLIQAGYSVDIAESAGAAETMATANAYDLVILDIMLPDQEWDRYRSPPALGRFSRSHFDADGPLGNQGPY